MKKNKEKLKVKAIKCPKCEDVIYSRARHDFHYCNCGAIFVDGGFDYLRYGEGSNNESFDKIENINLELDVTKEKLFDDWNKGINKFGIIKTKIVKE